MCDAYYENIENKVKLFVMKQLNEARLHPEDAVIIRSRACGAILFALNHLFPFYNDDLGDWWCKEILPQFRALEA